MLQIDMENRQTPPKEFSLLSYATESEPSWFTVMLKNSEKLNYT